MFAWLLLPLALAAQTRSLGEVKDAGNNELWLAREEAGWVLQIDRPSLPGPAFYLSAAQMESLRRQYRQAKERALKSTEGRASYCVASGIVLQAHPRKVVVHLGKSSVTVVLEGAGKNMESFENLLARTSR